MLESNQLPIVWIEFAVCIPKLVAEEVFETSNPAYEAFIYPDSPQ